MSTRTTHRYALAAALTSLVMVSVPSRPATAGVPGPQGSSAPAAVERYRDTVFSDVKVTKGIFYSRQLDVNLKWIDLKFDLYEPVGDTEQKRPLIIWGHGGWFAFGDRGDGDVDVALRWAKRGFVVASIDYRLDPGNGWQNYDTVDEALANERFMRSVLAGMADIGSAIDYFRKNVLRYGLHTNAIFTSGYSAGATGSLVQAYIPFNNNHPFKSNGVVAIAGTALPEMVDPAEPPALMFHGTKDRTLAYSHAKAFCDGSRARGGDCTMITYTGLGHDLGSKTEETMETSSNWLFDKVMAGAGFTTEVYPLYGSTYHGLTGDRLLDTRDGLGAPQEQLGPGEVIELQVTGNGGVPAGAPATSAEVEAAAMNLTVTGGSDSSHLTVWPTGEALPTSSSINFEAGQTAANTVITKVGVDGKVSIRNNSGTVDVIADVDGWYGPDPAGERFRALPPARLLDTRYGPVGPAAKIGAGSVVDVPVAGQVGVPATGAESVILNLTATNPSAGTHISAWPSGEPLPTTSSLNVAAGDTVANLVIAKIGANGMVSLRNESGEVDLVADVAGWFGSDPHDGSGYFPLDPSRIVDTRTGVGAPAARLTAGAPLVINPLGKGGVPQFKVRAVAVNVTAIGPSTWTHLTAWPGDEPEPVASNINVRPGQNRANFVVVPVGADGTIAIANNTGTTHLAVDIAGWFG